MGLDELMTVKNESVYRIVLMREINNESERELI